MPLFDTHCHLDCEEFDADREQVVANCKKIGVEYMLLPGITAATWPRLQALAATDPAMFYVALGLHPIYLAEHHETHLELLQQKIAAGGVHAVGEIGLDFFVGNLDPERQTFFFERQLDIAKQANLPVILHVRKAHDQVLSLLRKKKLKGGIVHAYSGSEQQAQVYVDLGFKIGIGGTVTYERANKVRRLAQTLPLSAIVLETDAPDISPVKHKGERNSPEYLLEVLDEVARLRQTAAAIVAKDLLHHSQSLFES